MRTLSPILAALISLLMLSRGISADIWPAGYDWRAADPIEYAHVVVEGTIDAMDIRNIGGKLVDTAFSKRTAMAVLHLRDMRVLRGPAPVDSIYGEFDQIDWRN